MKNTFEKMESTYINWKRIYTSTLSRTSLQSIAKVYIDEILSENMLSIVAQDVRDDFSKIVAEASKYARRTRSSTIKMEHLLFALEQYNVSLNLLHVDYAWPETEGTENAEAKSKAIKRKFQKRLSSTAKRIRLTPTEQKLSWKTFRAPRSWLKREQVMLLANKKFPLSKEQQEFYLLLTDTCMGTSEITRRDALQRLSSDSSLQSMLPKLTLFLAEAVKVNVAQHNFALLIYLMRMVHSLLVNPHLKIHNFLHLLIPAVISCAVAHQLCAFPAVQNHWALREYAGIIMSEIIKNFDCNNNNLMHRVINVYRQGLERTSLTTIYGSLIGLAKMGKYAIRDCVIPQIRNISKLIEPSFWKNSSDNDLNKQASLYIRHRLLKMCSPVLKNLHEPTDSLEEYSKLYGFLGFALHDAVIIERILEEELAAKEDKEEIITE